MACHITGRYDVNRSHTLPDNDFSQVHEWADSLAALGMSGILFHNNFSTATCEARQSKHLRFIRIDDDPSLSPNVYRYLAYRDFLRAHAHQIEALFVTDVADVVALNNPFEQPLFLANGESLFCGDEPKPLDNAWMREHSAHLRANIRGYADYEARHAASTLLNCGIIGGRTAVMQAFIEQLSDIHHRHNRHNPSAYTGDMGAFNYVARTSFKDRLLHGSPINTVFKAYEQARTDCWFRHK